jgi:uncharacterized membrane protein (DUF2068 family)
MDRRNWNGAIGAIQLVNTFLLFVFSIYLAVQAYPVVAFFQEREVTTAYIVNVAVFVALGILSLVCWLSLRKERLWGWWLSVSANAVICVFLTVDSLSLGLRDTYFQLAVVALLSAVVVVLLLTRSVRGRYSRRGSIQMTTL